MATAQQPVSAERAELEQVLQSEVFSRAPALSHLLSYLCEKTLNGEGQQIKEYSIAVDVFGRGEGFDQESNSIVRVQANRLRKHLANYYATEGVDHKLRITIPVGQYAPVFESVQAPPSVATPVVGPPRSRTWVWVAIALGVGLVSLAVLLLMSVRGHRASNATVETVRTEPPAPVGLPFGDEVRIQAGGTRDYIDRAGKTWSADQLFSGGMAVHTPVQHVSRTLEPEIYRHSRQGDFTYDIPLKKGLYELRLHFAEMEYGLEDHLSGGEGSRLMSIAVNGKPALNAFDVVSDAGGSSTADVKVFTDIEPASDGKLHIAVSSIYGGRGMLSAIEILPGVRGHIRPVRILPRDSSYYSNDSHWWSPDNYFLGGQLSTRLTSLANTDDPELYESERWGHFSYAIPVTPGRYTALLHFVERRFGRGNRESQVGPPLGEGARVFSVSCNGVTVLRDLDILKEAGENRVLIKKITGLEPNAQGKLVFDFVPVEDYATVSAIEILPE
ncbi:MAG TPA: malectin domain-containing carbohydrate-binding protein [Terriglobales bacterium]|nr:malectin domain-containing carbohydrate-binding protein [Terriglobales bacterium]